MYVNARAAETIRSGRAVSLLMVGVDKVAGDFEEGDLVRIIEPDGTEIALGRSSYDADAAARMIGKHGVRPIVHYDYMVVN